jgi:hypothetical protein
LEIPMSNDGTTLIAAKKRKEARPDQPEKR